MAGPPLDVYLARCGLTVHAHLGWQTRGGPGFNPVGVVVHHTGPPADTTTMVKVCINGRPDLPGPLCHVVVAPDGVCHLIAARTANHAGRGRWNNITGNRTAFGVEAVHDGKLTTAWPVRQIQAMALCAAALVRYVGEDAGNVCAHREFALPKGRKVDPIGLDMGTFRDTVRQHLAAWLAPRPPEENPVANNPDLPDIEGPLQIQVLQDQAGNCTGYLIFSTKTGELHGFGPGWRYFGRSEDPTPG